MCVCAVCKLCVCGYMCWLHVLCWSCVECDVVCIVFFFSVFCVLGTIAVYVRLVIFGGGVPNMGRGFKEEGLSWSTRYCVHGYIEAVVNTDLKRGV